MFSIRGNEALSYVQADRFPNLATHAFSTSRHGLDLSFSVFGDKKDGKEDWKKFLKALHLHSHPLAFHSQEHKTHIREVKLTELKDFYCCLGKGDALWTQDMGLTLSVVTADCMPVFVVGEGEKPFVAAIHAGWRGMAEGILSKSLSEIASKTAFDFSDITVVAGPHIGPCCFEIGEDVADILTGRGNRHNAEIVSTGKNGRKHGNLGKLLRAECKSLGIFEDHVLICDMCTCCHDDLLYSYRASVKTELRRMGNVIALLPDGNRGS